MEFNTAEKGASAGDNAKSLNTVSLTITDVLYLLKPVTKKKTLLKSCQLFKFALYPLKFDLYSHNAQCDLFPSINS